MNSPEKFKTMIRSIPDYPKKGIIFRDITTLLNNPVGFKLAIDLISERIAGYDFDAIAGIESRGFIIGGAVAYKLDKRFIPLRKAGKLPYETVSYEYSLEYGTDTIEAHTDALVKGEKIVIIDDLLATGGTAIAAAKLIEMLGGDVVELDFIVSLPDIGGEKALESEGYTHYSICHFEGE